VIYALLVLMLYRVPRDIRTIILISATARAWYEDPICKPPPYDADISYMIVQNLGALKK
jgi:hypothetical protein